jgi:hypothetical protein
MLKKQLTVAGKQGIFSAAKTKGGSSNAEHDERETGCSDREHCGKYPHWLCIRSSEGQTGVIPAHIRLDRLLVRDG